MIITSGIFEHLSAMINKAKRSVLIISPFYTHKMISHVCSLVKDRDLDCRFITLPPGEEYLMGLCDYGSLKDLEKVKIKFRFIEKLHAKLYIIDGNKALIGSANLTESGLTGRSAHNDDGAYDGKIEAMTELKITENEYNNIINSLWDEAIPSYYDQGMDDRINEQKEKIVHSNIGELSTVIKERFGYDNAYSRLLRIMQSKEMIEHYEKIQKGFGRNAYMINDRKRVKISLSTDRKIQDGAVYYSYTLSSYVKGLLNQLHAMVFLFEEPDAFAWVPISIMKEEVLRDEFRKAGDVWQFQIIRDEDKTILKIRSKNKRSGKWKTKTIDITRHANQIIQRSNPLKTETFPKPSIRKRHAK